MAASDSTLPAGSPSSTLAAPVDRSGAVGVPASALAPTMASPEVTATVYAESALRRAESVFFISLPFTALYAAIASVGVAFAIEGRRLKLDDRVVIPTVSLAVLASSYIAWNDRRAAATPP